MAHEIGWYAADVTPDLDTRDLDASLYQLLSEAYGLTLDAGSQAVRAEACDPRRGALLEVRTGAPLLVFDRTSTAGSVAVEHMTSWYRGDRYQVQMHLDATRPRSHDATEPRRHGATSLTDLRPPSPTA
jgi:GntR family transcriptional regulator